MNMKGNHATINIKIVVFKKLFKGLSRLQHAANWSFGLKPSSARSQLICGPKVVHRNVMRHRDAISNLILVLSNIMLVIFPITWSIITCNIIIRFICHLLFKSQIEKELLQNLNEKPNLRQIIFFSNFNI